MTENNPNTHNAEDIDNINKFIKKRTKFGGLSFVILLTLVVFAINSLSVFMPKYDEPPDRQRLPVLYLKDSSLYVKPLGKRSNELSSALSSDKQKAPPYDKTIALSQTGNSLYFLENYHESKYLGALYVSYNGKTKSLVSYNVLSNFKLSQTGEAALYITNFNTEKSIGSLYLHKKDKQPINISNNANVTQFQFDYTGKGFGYLEPTNSENQLCDLYYQDINGGKEKIDSDVVYLAKISDKKTAMYFKRNTNKPSLGDLYYWQKGHPGIKIAENVAITSNGIPALYASNYSDKVMYIAQNSDLKTYDLYSTDAGKKTKKIDTNLAMIIDTSSNNDKAIYGKNFSDYKSDVYIKTGKTPPLLISAAQPSVSGLVKASYDFRRIAYFTDYDKNTGVGKLHVKKYDILGNVTDSVVSEGVSSVQMSQSGNVLAYITGNSSTETGVLHVLKGNKEIFKTQNITPKNYRLTEKGDAVYFLDSYNATKKTGNLFIKHTSLLNKKQTKIESDVQAVFFVRNSKTALFFKNFDEANNTSNLYQYKGNGKSELVDNGNIEVLFEKR